MLNLIRKFARSRRGSIAVMTALSAPVVFAIVGVAIDYFMMVHIKGQLQIAADSAAIAGVKELSLSGATDKQVTAVAESFVYTNLGELSEKDITEGNLGIDVKIAKEKRTVEVAIKQEWTPFFMQFVNSGRHAHQGQGPGHDNRPEACLRARPLGARAAGRPALVQGQSCGRWLRCLQQYQDFPSAWSSMTMQPSRPILSA